MSISTGNTFADYLLFEYSGETYDMMDKEKAYSFIQFFDFPLVYPDKNDQLTFVFISSSAYIYGQYGNFRKVADQDWIYDSHLRYNKNLYTPGDMVLLDYYTDEYLYYGKDIWCLNRTNECLDSFQIKLKTSQYTISYHLHSVDKGIFKDNWQWKYNTPYCGKN